MNTRWIGMLVVVAALMLWACGGDEGAAGPGETAAKGVDTKAGPKQTGGPPADYIKWKCSECDCRVFGGDGAECTRPSCRHHWSSHQRPPGGG